MSKFLKLKVRGSSDRVLVATDAIAFVSEAHSGSIITLKYTGEEVGVDQSYQTLVNRLTKDEEASAE